MQNIVLQIFSVKMRSYELGQEVEFALKKVSLSLLHILNKSYNGINTELLNLILPQIQKA